MGWVYCQNGSSGPPLVANTNALPRFAVGNEATKVRSRGWNAIPKIPEPNPTRS